MSSEYFYGARRKPAATRLDKTLALGQRRGTPATGRIVKLLVGQGHGFIRLPDNRDIFFHRADVQEGTSINDLDVGHTVKFELLDDPVSGGRALHVRRHSPRR
jgi:cold shock CspA family protein